jgi:hypothetical protein
MRLENHPARQGKRFWQSMAGKAMGWLNKKLFGISPEEASPQRRGFENGIASVRQRIERIGAHFIEGYGAALLDDDPERLAAKLNQNVESEFLGFAFEGAGMGLAIADFMNPFRASRLQAFLAGPARRHDLIVHIGAGWAWAKLPVRLECAAGRMDPVLRWLAIDGYGFHQGFFHGRRFIENREEPKRLSPYGRCAFDHGLGRSLWFFKAGDAGRMALAIAGFPPVRRPHLWSGVGLACAYAGGVERAGLLALKEASGVFLPQLRLGVALAALSRAKAGNPAEWTALACDAVCGGSFSEIAAIASAAGEDLPGQGETPAYAVWRQRIQTRLA